jgi:transcription-repair coupling factor (superfamily II helicase)
VTIETDVEMLIPDEYVSNSAERLSLYTQLDEIKDEAGITAFSKMLEDRFGKIPKQVNFLFDGLRLRWLCKKIGFRTPDPERRETALLFCERPAVVIL